MGMTHKEQELTQAKDMLQIKLERLEKEIEELKRQLKEAHETIEYLDKELSLRMSKEDQIFWRGDWRY